MEKKENKRVYVAGLLLGLAALIIVFLVEQVWKPGYFIKSAVKLCSFACAVVLYAVIAKRKVSELIRLKRPKNVKKLVLCTALFFFGIGILFLIFKNNIDWTNIRQSLVTKEGLTRTNCFFVFAYIILVNSFLEEAFFRGFLSGLIPNRTVSFPLSALLFSVYHVGIIGTWFHPFLLIFCIVGLAAVGLFLQFLLERYHSVVASYIVHASANVAINTIGALLIFEILK